MPMVLPLIGPALGAAGLVSAGTATGLGIAGSLAGGLLAGNKAAGAAGAAAPQVDIDRLNEQIKQLATSNAEASRALEERLTPEIPQLRTAANLGVLNQIGQTPYNQQSQDLLAQQLNDRLNFNPVTSSLLNNAVAQAQSELALGGQLSPEIRNLVARTAGARAAGVGGGNLGLARDMTARDLGLTSLQLQQQRLANAGALAGQETGLGLANANLGLNTYNTNLQSLINRISTLQSLQDTNFNRAMMAAQYGQSIQQPQVGLDPSAMANISIGNQNVQQARNANLANVYGQQSGNMLRFGGQLLGYGMLNRGGVGGQFPAGITTSIGMGGL